MTAPTTTANNASRRAALRAELAATQAAVQQLFVDVSAADWRRRSANPAWTVGELLAHLTWRLEQLPREVELARQGRGLYNLPRFLRDPLNVLVTRLYARRHTPQTLARRYDAACAAAVRTLDAVGEDEWGRGAPFWGEGFHDIEALFRAQALHIAEHAGDIRAVLPQGSESIARRRASVAAGSSG
jgi:hypothetical protein